MRRSYATSAVILGAALVPWSGFAVPPASEVNLSIDYAVGLVEQGFDAAKHGTRPSSPECHPSDLTWPDCLKPITPQGARTQSILLSGKQRLKEQLNAKGLQFGSPIYLRAFNQSDIDWSLSFRGAASQSGTLPEKL